MAKRECSSGKKPAILRAYASFFLAVSFLAERTMATPNGLVSARAPSPTLTFLSVASQQPTSCSPFNITWSYTGPSLPITLTVSNDSVPQPAPTKHFTDTGIAARAVPTGATNPTPFVTFPLSTSIQPYSASFLWTSVNVSQGWYVLEATAESGLAVTSPQFFVSGSSVTSCLFGSITTTITSMKISTSTRTDIVLPTGPALPLSGASSSSSHAGVIAGCVIGAIVFLALALSAWFWFLRKRAAAGTAGAAKGPRRWNGLSSVDSRGGLFGTPRASAQRDESRGASLGTLPMSPSEEAVAAAEKASMYSSKHADAHALSGLPVLPQAHPASREGRTLHRTASIASTVSTAAPHVGRQSDDSSTGYPPSSPGARGTYAPPAPSLSRAHSLANSLATSTTHTGYGAHSTSSHAALMSAGTSFTSADERADTPSSPTGMANRRRSLGPTRRKPVPAYAGDPYDGAPGMSPTSPMSPMSPTSPVSPSPGAGESNGTQGHYVTRSHAGHSQHELLHKSSFGPGGIEGKALHYLMPDPPMAPTRG